MQIHNYEHIIIRTNLVGPREFVLVDCTVYSTLIGLLFCRPASGKQSYSSLIDHEIYMARRPKKKKPLYKRQPYVIRCTAYKNGDRDICSQMAAPNIKLLLESCTSKLQLNGAARRIFLEDGTEIFETEEIPKDGEIYVSNGEAFKNPYKTIIRKIILLTDFNKL